jgi:hypothetical protein
MNHAPMPQVRLVYFLDQPYNSFYQELQEIIDIRIQKYTFIMCFGKCNFFSH